ncbi:MAG: glycosyltransferase family 2 protein [Chloroflexi bacterium]|nr:glycosyltransferase family 2 protein [Chloroflexota bacterium]
MRPAGILVILPAYNEELNIARTVGDILARLPEVDVLVVNDGSADDTSAEAQRAGAQVLELPFNVGIGAAVQAGFQFAAAQDYDTALRNDGDGQHSPESNLALLESLAAHDVDVVIGSRFISARGDYGTPRLRRLGSGILARLLSVIIGQRVTDPTSGCSAYNREAIKLLARFYPHDYPEPEAIVILHRSGLRQMEVPVTMTPRLHGQSSITPLRSVYYMIKVILAILINLLRRRPQTV